MNTRKSIQVVLRVMLALFIALAGVLQASAIPVSAYVYDCATDQTEIPEYECNALKALYDDTGGTASWGLNTNWFITAPSLWYGVTVEGGHVTQLNYPNNNLTGPLPTAIGDLPELNRLNITYSYLNGSLPTTLGNLTKLTYIDFYRNDLSGTIPTFFGSMSALDTLSLAPMISPERSRLNLETMIIFATCIWTKIS